MNIEEFREFCLSFKGSSESMPFDDKVLVFKVLDKMFALTDIDTFESVNLKCEPEKSLELRTKYESVKPGYHMSKKHWNTILMDGEMSDDELESWIKHSYDLVVAKMTKKQKKLLEEY